VYPFIKVSDQASFEAANLNAEYDFAVSIQGKGASPAVLRPDFSGKRLDLYFDDTTEGPGAPGEADLEALLAFGWEWAAAVRREPSLRTIIHCGAGVSRSGASALLLLSLYFGSYLAGAVHLYRCAPHVMPNALLCRLIFARLGPAYGPDISEALARGREATS
jgi:predicted protein tyrosine phosphatase